MLHTPEESTTTEALVCVVTVVSPVGFPSFVFTSP